jgi:putative Holliday junction resolvase
VQKEFDKTYLAIDYGSRRIGRAKSDPTGTIASALVTIEVKSMNEAVKKVVEIIEKYEPNAVVIGYPLLSSGEKSRKCLEVDEFAERIAESYKGAIHKVDESWSSAEAQDVIHAHGKRVGKKKDRLDRIAAVIILQRFLDGER